MQINRSTLAAIGIVAAILLAGYGLGYTSHKEYVPIIITSTEFRTVTMTETITTTVYEVKNITVLLYKPIEQLEVSIRKLRETTLRMYVTNRGNTTLYNIVIYIKALETLLGQSTTREIFIEDIEPGVTRTYDIWVPPFTKYLYMIVLPPEPVS
jgi:hypothetical protein